MTLDLLAGVDKPRNPKFYLEVIAVVVGGARRKEWFFATVEQRDRQLVIFKEHGAVTILKAERKVRGKWVIDTTVQL